MISNYKKELGAIGSATLANIATRVDAVESWISLAATIVALVVGLLALYDRLRFGPKELRKKK